MIQIHNFLSKDLCEFLIKYFHRHKKNSRSFRQSTIIDLVDPKNNELTIQNLRNVYKKIYPLKQMAKMELISWDVGESHDWHEEQYEETTITYLNDGFQGGRTQVGHPPDGYKVEPHVGKIILFPSSVQHKSNELILGERYVIMTWYKNG